MNPILRHSLHALLLGFAAVGTVGAAFVWAVYTVGEEQARVEAPGYDGSGIEVRDE